jgi:PucR C-terminal helix-turn-helix domain
MGNLSGGELARLVPALGEHLPQILSEVRDRFRSEWPDYAEFLEHEQGEVSAAAIAFLTWLVEAAEQPYEELLADAEHAPHASLFEEIGRIQWREGRDLTSLLSAYQVGARVAWHHVSQAALEVGVERDALAALAEAVFVFVDQLSSSSARGYVREQSEAGAERERQRDELVELLLSGRSDATAVRAAASRAGWTLPHEAAVILVEPDNTIAQSVMSRLDSSCLLIRRRAMSGAIVPTPAGPGLRQRLTRALRGAGAVVGHAVALEHLPASVQIADTAVTLLREGILADDPVFVDEHLDAILVHRDPRLLAALRRRVLAPLDGQPAAVQERLVETLTSWLRHFGDRRAMAAELHVHPQTVRYRMGQLHALFGPVLDTPEARVRLVLALGWNRPSGPPSGPPVPAADRANRPASTTSGRSRGADATGERSSSVARNAATKRSASSTNAGATVTPTNKVPSHPITPTPNGAPGANGSTG